MRRNIILLVVILLVFFPYFVHSVTTFVVQETEKLKIEPKTYDPDNDNLSIHCSPPLDENGEWQTTYGDAGSYDSEIAVSDGKTSVSEEIQIIVLRKEEAPLIDLYAPQSPIHITEGKSIMFNASASDLNNDPLTYTWYTGGKKSGEGRNFIYSASFNDAGTHKVKIIVSDGLFDASIEWDVIVEDFDVNRLLGSINGILIDEGEKASLELPDFEAYGLTYSISDPIGNDNEWLTDFDGEGSYNVEVEAEGNGFIGSVDVEVIVNNVDRSPIFKEIDNLVLKENHTVQIVLKAEDPDGDEITYYANDLPEGASFEGNIFAWTPSFDTVKKDNFVDYMLDKFKVLNKNFYVQFAAESNGKLIVSNVVITVQDVNRAPIIEDFAPINVRETETINIIPNAYDLDGDSIKITYSGFMTGSTYATNFNDAGVYDVKVTANDGVLETSRIVQVIVNNTNRAPIFEKIPEKKVKEGEEAIIILNSYDPDNEDNDGLRYSIENQPEDYSLDGNVFTWIPSYSTAGHDETKTFEIIFAVGDGRLAARQVAKIQVENVNRAPVILNYTKGALSYVDSPVNMFVEAFDPDGDELTYVWDFGLLEKYQATNKHQRIYTTPGNKEIKVKISDGLDSVEQPITVTIVGNKSKDMEQVDYLNRTYTSTRIINITIKQKSDSSEKTTASNSISTNALINVPPRIVDASTYVVAKINQPVLLFVKAVDDNNDPLKYTWDFGFWDKHEGTAYHQRTFTTAGTKTAKVTVSDGTYSVQHVITVTVV